jgi:hypothetical protein
MRLTGPSDARWRLAVERLAAGDQVEVAGLVLRLASDGPTPPGPTASLVIELDAPTWWNADMGEAQEQRFRARVDQAWADVEQLLLDSSEFRAAVGARDRRLEVVDDYGMGVRLKAVVFPDGAVNWIR